jgi:DNA-binding LacI/PurR family transcriptional regulator
MEAARADKKSVLVIGLDPTRIDFSQPGYAPGMEATKGLAGLKSSEEELTRLGYSVQMCLTDFGETAEAGARSQLKRKRFDCILIGAGVRTNPSNVLLFEKFVNVVHDYAPQAKLCFNTLSSDTAAAVQRWL